MSMDKIDKLEVKIFELNSDLKEHRDKERIYQEILSDINYSIMVFFKREEENERFNLGDNIDYRQNLIGLKDYLDEIKKTYNGKIKF